MAKKTGPEKEHQNRPVTLPPQPAAPPSNPEPPVVTDERDEEQQPGSGERFGIVGIGASAGGLEAFSQLLQFLPIDTGMAFVFVQHLDPKHVSILNELLQRQTTMLVQEVRHGTHIQPNRVYVIPRNTNMRIVNGVLTLSPRPVGVQNLPIDTFLTSLAQDQKDHAIGVILSGTASDGAQGILAIKAEGGITFAQDNDSAKFDSMPRSSVAAGCVDFVLPPDKIARELARLAVSSPVFSPGLEQPWQGLADNPDGLNKITTLLRVQTGVDLALYKQSTIKRRILRRLALKKFDSLDRYLALLRSDPAEVRTLFEDILINVTEFFRDPEVFEALRSVVFSKLLQKVEDRGPVRIWVPGCSTGEEVYSIAIALVEAAEEQSVQLSFQIFGTDIGERALERARSGVFALTIAQNVSADRLRRFFIKTEGGFQINKRIREACIFARQNVSKDPPFSNLDLVSCRNLLIYLGPVLQRRALSIFHYALKPSGFLLLGSSETIGALQDLFGPADKKYKIYSRLDGPRRLPADFALADHADRVKQPSKVEIWPEPDVVREADRIALAKYAPSGVVIDREMNVVQFRGHVGSYLEPASGAASLNVLKMSREGLFSPLRGAIEAALAENKPVRRDSLRIRNDGGSQEFAIEVIPFKRIAGRPELYLILFEASNASGRLTQIPAKQILKGGQPALIAENSQLRRDLEASQDYLQSVIEEQEASNEELRSANEEIQSSNEELQSTNEELETAKEELQSTNEELNTINEELNTRNTQLTQTGNDLLNLLSNVNLPIVMLGNDLRIRRFTPVSEKILNLIPTDIGRPITHIKFNLDIPDLEQHLLEVIRTLQSKTLDVQDWNSRRYSLRIRPYRTEDNRIEGAVMVLVDVGARNSFDEAAAGDIKPPELKEPEATGDQLRVFARSLLAAQEDERRKVSRELHDELNQRLALLELDVEGLERKPAPAKKIAAYLRSFRERVTELSDDVRRIAYQLHPSVLDDLGLVVALESYCRDFSTRENIAVAFRHTGVPEALPQDVSLTVYRVVQEALRNVAKHSGASKADISIEGHPTGLDLRILDEGVGFAAVDSQARRGLGLISIEERVHLLEGTIKIDSKPGDGTKILAKIPIHA